MTNQELIDQALKENGYLDAGVSAGATDSADALDVQNQMMAAWAVSGKDLQYFPQDTLGDTVPIPIWAEEGVVSNLSLKLCAAFDIAPTQALILKAEEGRNVIARTVMRNNIENADLTHLPWGRGNYANILTDA